MLSHVSPASFDARGILLPRKCARHFLRSCVLRSRTMARRSARRLLNSLLGEHSPATGINHVLPRRRARRRQDLRDARTRAAARHDRGTDVVVGFVETHGRPAPRPRSAIWSSFPVAGSTYRGTIRGDGRRRGDRPPARRSRSSTSWRTPTSRARATRSAGRTSSELLDAGIDVITTREHPASRVAERRGRAHHRGSSSARRCPTSRPPRRPDRAGRHDAGGAAPPDGARQRLQRRAGRRRARQLLPAGQPRRAAGAGAALARRPSRRGAGGLSRAPRHQRAVGDAGAGAGRAHRRARR